MPTSPARGKDWGYEVEALTLRALQGLSPDFRRTGASNQKEGGDPDIVLDGKRVGEAVLLVVTKDKGRGHPLLVTCAMEDFLTIATVGLPARDIPILVGVKGRARTWVGTLWGELHAWAMAHRAPKREGKMHR